MSIKVSYIYEFLRDFIITTFMFTSCVLIKMKFNDIQEKKIEEANSDKAKNMPKLSLTKLNNCLNISSMAGVSSDVVAI